MPVISRRLLPCAVGLWPFTTAGPADDRDPGRGRSRSFVRGRVAQECLDVHRRRPADHSQQAAAHPEPPLVDRRRRLDLEPPVVSCATVASSSSATTFPAAWRSPSTRSVPSPGRGRGSTRSAPAGARRRRRSRSRADARRACVPGVEAVGVDRQLDPRAVRPDLVRAAEAVEAAADGEQAPEGLHREVDRAPVGVGRPARPRGRPLVVCGGGARPRPTAGGGGMVMGAGSGWTA